MRNPTAVTGTRAPLTAAIVLLLCATWSGCGDDGTKGPPAPGSVEGTVTEVKSGAPVGDAALVLIDVQEMTVASGIAGTDGAGHYRIDGVAPGDYAALVFHDSLVVRERQAPQVHVSSKRVTTFDINVVEVEFIGKAAYHIEGTVIDAQTLEPVAGAYVGPAIAMGEELVGYGAGLAFWSAVTDSSGHFLAPALDLEFFFGDKGLAPITVTKEGYEPYTLIGNGVSIPSVVPPLLPLPADDDMTLHVEVSLLPLGDEGTGPHGAGAIAGRLMSFGGPVAGVLVGASISTVSEPDTFRAPPTSAVPVPQKVARTDALGRFLLEGLTPGEYAIDPAFLDNDGYVKLALGDPLAFRCVVVDSQTCDLGVLEIGRAIRPISPENRSTVQDTTPEFRWSAVGSPPGYGPVQYRVEYGTGYVLDTGATNLTEPRWQMPDSKAFAPGDHARWHAVASAFNPASGDTVDVAAFEWPATFSVAE